MKRSHSYSMVAIGVAAVALVFAGTVAQAGGLKGEYRFVGTDVRWDNVAMSVTYCSTSGTVVFINGTNTANVASTDRCVEPGKSPEITVRPTAIFTYTVDANGEVIITEPPPESDTTHCRVAESGKMLLCDALGKDDSVLLWNTIAVQK